MDTRKLHFFTVLSETGNMREAASLLNISHAGLSKAIHTLEEEIGEILITKDGRGIKITLTGRRLLNNMQACLKAEQDLLREAKGLKHNPRIRIGTFEVFSTYLSPKLVQRLEEHAEVSFEESIPGDLEAALSSEKIDFGITYIPIPKPDLDHLEITKIQMGIFANKRLSAKFNRFEDLPFVIPVSNVEGAPTKVKGLDGWPDDRIHRNIRYSVTLMETALALVREGLAVGYFPKFVVELHNKFVKSEFSLKELQSSRKFSKEQPVYAIKRKDCTEDAPFKALCLVLRSLK